MTKWTIHTFLGPLRKKNCLLRNLDDNLHSFCRDSVEIVKKKDYSIQKRRSHRPFYKMTYSSSFRNVEAVTNTLRFFPNAAAVSECDEIRSSLEV
jgi:hypothetical protein